MPLSKSQRLRRPNAAGRRARRQATLAAVTRVHDVVAEYDAPIERVWQLYSEPRQLERFWGPPTWPATVVDHDLSPGGRVTYFMTGPDGEKSAGLLGRARGRCPAPLRGRGRLRRRRRSTEPRHAEDPHGARARPSARRRHHDDRGLHLRLHRRHGADARNGHGGRHASSDGARSTRSSPRPPETRHRQQHVARFIRTCSTARGSAHTDRDRAGTNAPMLGHHVDGSQPRLRRTSQQGAMGRNGNRRTTSSIRDDFAGHCTSDLRRGGPGCRRATTGEAS